MIISFVFNGCSKNGKHSGNKAFIGDYEMEEALDYEAPKMMMAKSRAVSANFLTTDSMAESYYDGSAMSDSVSGGNNSFERKLIKNGNISLQVQELDSAEASVEKWCKQYGGYINSSNRYENSCNFSVKIPCDSFDEAMESLGNIGSVRSRGVSVRDVSEQFYDLQSRLETKKVLQKNLNKYLEQATNLTDILKIERELNNVTSELESMEGQLRRLSNQIEYSTIDIYMELPMHQVVPDIEKPTLSERMMDFLFSVKSFFGAVLKVIIYGIVCGIPCVAALIFLYWLLLGKVGLLKKIWKKIK